VYSLFTLKSLQHIGTLSESRPMFYVFFPFSDCDFCPVNMLICFILNLSLHSRVASSLS